MNTDRINRDNYVFKTIPIVKEQNKNACFRLLTLTNRHILLCHNTYDEKYINSVIESSNYFLYYTTRDNINEILCFALVKITTKHVCDIMLLCAIPNELQYGNMLAYSLQGFAINKKCNKIYTSPRTELLRKTFIKYGFEHLRGIKNYDEVLVKHIIPPSKFIKTSFTLRKKKLVNNTNKGNNSINNNLNQLL
jgi:hypothetical protein